MRLIGAFVITDVISGESTSDDCHLRSCFRKQRPDTRRKEGITGPNGLEINEGLIGLLAMGMQGYL